MKKPAFLLLALICAVSLAFPAAASETPDAYTLYKRAVKKMDATVTMEVKTVSTTETFLNGVSLGEEKLITMEKQRMSDGDLEMSAVTTSGLREERQVYYKGGYLYQAGLKVKTAAADVLDKHAALSDLTKDLVAASVKDGTVETLEDGNYKIRFEVAGQEHDNSLGNIFDMLSESDEYGFQIAFGSIHYAITLKPDGELVSYAYSYTMKLSDADLSMKVKTTNKSKPLSINQPINMDFPADLKSYTLAQ